MSAFKTTAERPHSLSRRLHRAHSLAANTYYWWTHRHYSLRMAWHRAKQTIN